jgi:hypothetical protein
MEGGTLALLTESTRPQARSLPALVAAALVVAVVFAGPALNAWSASRTVAPDDPPTSRPVVDFWGVSLFASADLAAEVSPARVEKSVRSAANGRLKNAHVTTVALMLATDREPSSGLGLENAAVYYVVMHEAIPASRRPGGPVPNTNEVATADCATFALVDATTAKVLGDLHFSCHW